MSALCCILYLLIFFFFKQKTAYEMRISDWSSDVCSSDLVDEEDPVPAPVVADISPDDRPQGGAQHGRHRPQPHHAPALLRREDAHQQGLRQDRKSVV